MYLLGCCDNLPIRCSVAGKLFRPNYEWSTHMRIVVLGYIIRGPLGGMAWHYLQYVVGLMRLGHDVRFVEDSDDYPACYDPSRHLTDCDPSYGLRFAADVFGRLGMAEVWSYYDAHTQSWLGPDAENAEQFCRSADLLLNLSGVNPLRDWTHVVPIRVFVDTDPLFTQVRNLTDSAARERARQHNVFFTYGENMDGGAAQVPDDGLHWRATRQPIVLDLWPVALPPPAASYTTVMQWQSHRPVERSGAWYGTKSASFQAYIDLPRRTTVPLEIALGGNEAPRSLLRKRGWSLRDPLVVALTPWDYQNYIRGSRGEVTVAKHGYVISRCGWFSDRSAAYLASGRPVVTQETGFSDWLPVGSGLFSFRNPAEALAALAEIEKDYRHHSVHARRLAEEYFDSAGILSRLIEQAIAMSAS
jgi:hypothetical protein